MSAPSVFSLKSCHITTSGSANNGMYYRVVCIWLFSKTVWNIPNTNWHLPNIIRHLPKTIWHLLKAIGHLPPTFLTLSLSRNFPDIVSQLFETNWHLPYTFLTPPHPFQTSSYHHTFLKQIEVLRVKNIHYLYNIFLHSLPAFNSFLRLCFHTPCSHESLGNQSSTVNKNLMVTLNKIAVFSC